MAADDPHEVQNWVRQRVLGSGGFGVVTLWKHKHREEMIAIKKCRSGTDNLLTPKHKERWSKEVEIMQRLCHPNVVRAISVPPDLAVLRSELPLLCMEFCSKGDLRQILNRGENCCGLQENDVRALIYDLTNAVQYLHSMKITHRDLKPENIVLQQNNTRIVYKLIDLGYAKELDQSSVCTSFVGTLQYLAPELFMSKSYTSSVDYWSLGLVSHEVITGVRPFLPNMAPVAWMNHVRSKSSDDICAYQTQDGNIVFCKEIFPQNHITPTLKYHMEEWLKILLEWDPKKRGRNKDMEIIVFELIETILKKKIVQLFCVETYEKLSYEVEESTALNTLKEWIRRDTGLALEEQELLLSNGNQVDPNKEAWQCWNPQYSKDGYPMVYVFRINHLGIPQVTPSIPSSVRRMMEEPRTPMEYIHQKRAWAHAVFFLRQENELYKTFYQSYRIKLLHMLSKHEQLRQKNQNLNNQMHLALAEHHLSLQSLHLDEEQLQKTKSSSRIIREEWLKNQEILASSINELNKTTSQINFKCEEIGKIASALKADPRIKINDLNVLQTLTETGLKCYDQLRRRPKETRSQKLDSIEMVKIVYNCLKQRDILMRDKEFNNHLQQLAELQQKIELLLRPVDQCIEEIKAFSKLICKYQLERQCSIWNLVLSTEKHMSHVHVNDVTSSIINNARHEIKEMDQTEPRHIEMNSLLSFSNIDTSAMIHENEELRYRTQEVMTESFQKVCSIVSEGQSFNWSHLNVSTNKEANHEINLKHSEKL